MKTFVWQVKSELIQLLRIPAFAISAIVFPVILFIFIAFLNFNNLSSENGGYGHFLMAGVIVLGVVGVLFFEYGIGVSNEREGGLFRHLRTTPIRPIIYLAAKIMTGVILSAISVLLVVLVAIVGFGIRFPFNPLLFILTIFIGALPFTAMGFALGYSVNPRAASATANLVYLPMSFLSGLFYDLGGAPEYLQWIANLSPMTYYANSVRGAMSGSLSVILNNLGILAIYTVIFAAIAIYGYQNDEYLEYS
ncbi:MAG: ABC transporter permease [Chloroflexota bacterium]